MNKYILRIIRVARIGLNMHRVSMHETSGCRLENRLGTKWLLRRILPRRCIGAALRSRRQYTARRRLVYMLVLLRALIIRYQRVPLHFSAHPSTRILFTSHPKNPRCGMSLFIQYFLLFFVNVRRRTNRTVPAHGKRGLKNFFPYFLNSNRMVIESWQRRVLFQRKTNFFSPLFCSICSIVSRDIVEMFIHAIRDDISQLRVAYRFIIAPRCVCFEITFYIYSQVLFFFT